MFKTYVKVCKWGRGGSCAFGVKFFLLNTLENYILKHFNNSQKRKDFYIIQKKNVNPLNFTFLCEIWIFAIFRCKAQNTKTAAQLSRGLCPKSPQISLVTKLIFF